MVAARAAGTEARTTARALDPTACYDALVSRDRRFDGLFFVGVSTTGIYCRPVCTARTPGRDRCTFFHHAAEAEHQGFRACFRCRPELAPGGAQVDARSRLVRAATARIDAGALDQGSVADLAAELGVTERHLRRTMTDEHGVSPIAWAETRRLALAKQLLTDPKLSIASIAFASGFGSVRRFNAVFARRFGRAPSGVRAATADGAPHDAATEQLRLRLDFRPPYDWARLLAFLAARAIPGVERVGLPTNEEPGHLDNGFYARTVASRGRDGLLVVTRARDQETALSVSLPLSLAGECLPILTKLRALFDLDAEPSVVAAHLGRDPHLKSAIAARPGLRVPGSFAPFETAVRAILGQQVSVAGATTISGRLVAKFGTPLGTDAMREAWHSPETDGLTHLFPTAATLASASPTDLRSIGLTEARAATVGAMARAFEDGLFDAYAAIDPAHLRERLLAITGIGPWTADYLLLRAAHWPDAFPAGDLVLRQQLGIDTPIAAEARATAWKPWRAYAAMQLWADAHPPGNARKEALARTKRGKK